MTGIRVGVWSLCAVALWCSRSPAWAQAQRYEQAVISHVEADVRELLSIFCRSRGLPFDDQTQVEGQAEVSLKDGDVLLRKVEARIHMDSETPMTLVGDFRRFVTEHYEHLGFRTSVNQPGSGPLFKLHVDIKEAEPSELRNYLVLVTLALMPFFLLFAWRGIRWTLSRWFRKESSTGQAGTPAVDLFGDMGPQVDGMNDIPSLKPLSSGGLEEGRELPVSVKPRGFQVQPSPERWDIPILKDTPEEVPERNLKGLSQELPPGQEVDLSWGLDPR